MLLGKPFIVASSSTRIPINPYSWAIGKYLFTSYDPVMNFFKGYIKILNIKANN